MFRAWLRPSTPEGRIAPVDDATARGLLVALNWVIVLPLIAGTSGSRAHQYRRRAGRRQRRPHPLCAVVAAGLLWVVWHWRNEMAAWLTAMVPQNKIGRQLKLDAARRWWIFGLVLYGLMGLAAIYAALTETATASHGLRTIESSLLVLLLFETLMHRITRHIVSELPMAGDVVADCLRLIAAALRADPDRRRPHGADAWAR